MSTLNFGDLKKNFRRDENGGRVTLINFEVDSFDIAVLLYIKKSSSTRDFFSRFSSINGIYEKRHGWRVHLYPERIS